MQFKYIIWCVFYRKFLNFHFLNILTNSKCKSFNNFQAIKVKCFLYVPQSMFNKTINSLFYISPISQFKNKVHVVETRKFRKLSFDKKNCFFSDYIFEIWVVSLLPDVSKILWKKIVRGDRFWIKVLTSKTKNHNSNSIRETSMKLCSMHSYCRRHMCAKN